MTTLCPFEVFVEIHRGLVMQTAMCLPRNFAEAQDITQEVFLQAYRHYSEVRCHPKASGWLRVVTRHLCINYLNRYRGRWSFFSELSEPGGDSDFEASLTAPQDGRVDPAVADRHRQFRAVLAALPAGQRIPLELFHFEGLDYQEIARRLGMTLSQVKNNIFRGRRKLRQRLSRRDFMPSAA